MKSNHLGETTFSQNLMISLRTVDTFIAGADCVPSPCLFWVPHRLRDSEKGGVWEEFPSSQSAYYSTESSDSYMASLPRGGIERQEAPWPNIEFSAISHLLKEPIGISANPIAIYTDRGCGSLCCGKFTYCKSNESRCNTALFLLLTLCDSSDLQSPHC